MSDSKIVGGFGSDCEGDGQRGKRGKRGHRGHRGQSAFEGPTPPFSTDVNFIYARPDGSDSSGNGTLAKPYATFSRAIRDVPIIIPPAVRYVVDITGVDETLPTDYELPAIKSSGYYGVETNDLDQRRYFTSLVIRAVPTLFTGVPAADAVILAGEVVSSGPDPVTGLITIQTTKSWAPGALRGALLTYTGALPGKRQALVYENTTNTIILANTSTDAQFVTGPFELQQQSATLRATNSHESYTGVGFRHIDSFVVDGVVFANTDPDPFAYSVNVVGSTTPIFAACSIEGIYVGPSTQYFYPNGTVFQNKTIESESQTVLLFAGCVLQDMATLYTYDVEELGLLSCGVRNCAALGPRPAVVFTPAVTTVGSGSATKMTVTNTQIDGSVADTDFGTPGYGILNNALSASIANVRISDCASDAIFCTSNGSATIQGAGGSGNGGVGIHADMGSQVSVDAATTVTGTGGDVKSGSLAAASYATLATTQQYDLPPNSANIGVATGARIFPA